MRTLVRPTDALDASEVQVRRPELVTLLEVGSGATVAGPDIEVYQGSPTEVATRFDWPIIETPDTAGSDAALHQFFLLHKAIFEYWMTTPEDLLGDVKAGGVKDFVAAANSGGLPVPWTQQPAEGPDGLAYTLCSFSLSMAQARSLGSEQRSLETLPGGDIPANVHFFQRVADIEAFTGIERVSQQPSQIAAQLYAPTDLYQTSHSGASEYRGSPFSEADVLSVTNLSLL